MGLVATRHGEIHVKIHTEMHAKLHTKMHVQMHTEMYAKMHGTMHVKMHAEMHAEMYATHEERGISNRAKCSARSTEIHVKMQVEMQFRANSLFLSFSPLFLYRVRAAEVS